MTIVALGCGVAARPGAADAPGASAAPAGEQPRAMFGGDLHRNAVNTVDKNVPTAWNVKAGAQGKILWSAKLGTKSYGGPVVAGGKVFVGTNNEVPRDPAVKGPKGIVMCFDAGTGRFLWQAVHDALPGDVVKDALPEGLPATPAVEGGRLYYVSNRCELVCADANAKAGGAVQGGANGTGPEIVWRLDMMKDLGVVPHKLPNGSPLVAGDLVFTATGNGADEEAVVHAPKAPSLIAVTKNTGKVVWQDNSPGDKIVMGQWSNPAYAVVNGTPQVIFGAGDGWLRGFNALTGQLIWKFDCNPKKPEGKTNKARNYIVATPVVHDNKVYVGVGQEPSLGSGIGHLWCVDITKTGDISPANDNFDPKAPANKNSGLVWHYGGPADEKTAEKTGRDYFFGRTISSCVVHDGLVYAAELAGYVYCFDAQTGQKYWEEDLKSEIWGSPCWVDGKVYIGTGDGDVWIFAHGKEKKQIAKVEDMGAPIYSTPTVANGVLYVMTMKELFAIK